MKCPPVYSLHLAFDYEHRFIDFLTAIFPVSSVVGCSGFGGHKSYTLSHPWGDSL